MRKNKIIISILSIILIIGIVLILLLNFNAKTEIEDIKTEIEEDTNTDIEKRILLADILKQEDEILITEDNIDKTNEIIKNANLKKGIFISEDSREKFLEILNISTENTYLINDDGYLKEPTIIAKENDLTKKINNYIYSNKTIVINISNTYKGLIDGMILDFMIERTTYTHTFDYNNNIRIVLINPDRINEQSEDLTQKQIYEEVLLGI